MTSTQPARRPAARTIGERRAVARQLARDLLEPSGYGGDWQDAAIGVPAGWPPAYQMLDGIRWAVAEAGRIPGRTWIGYRRVTGDSVIIFHGRDWSLVFAAEGQSGIAGRIYLVFDADVGAFPAALEHDSRRVVEFSLLFHETFGPAARCWD